MRRSTLLFVALTVVIGLGLFQLKYQVMTLEQQYRHTRHSIKESDEAIHILKAEWTHLNEPGRLQALSVRYLNIEPIKASQLISFKEAVGRGAKGDASYDSLALDQLVAEIAADSTLAPTQDD